MFEITGQHIIQLNDADLRTLVARLCEAELRQRGFSASAVTASGAQDAPDGGVDVRVSLPQGFSIMGFIPRPLTVFQVKVPDMGAAKIADEMRPAGNVRIAIQELASASGAYIIISSKASTTDTTLRARLVAMRKAVAGIPSAESLALDFYDRERIASWTRAHPGMIAWVRDKIGQPINGWRPYECWAAPGESIEAPFLVDDKKRFFDKPSQDEGSLSILDGINRIRKVLAQPKGVVRLVGLSGMGKTRLAQALFDHRIGTDSLDPSLAIYTDVSILSDPAPTDLMRRLNQNRQRAIILVDNCSPSTHRTLAGICKEQDSILSLITIEYDVSDDEPEGTEVFRLEPASNEVIEHLLEHHVPDVSQVDRRRIAEISDGNARIAIALASTVGHGESIAALADKVLFERLFYQRDHHDLSLLRAAEVCSFVYSFDGETLDSETAELPLLAELATMSADQLYGGVSGLQSKHLVQRRGQWRAVLPQALAIRLAKQAMERIPPARIEDVLVRRGSDRIKKSFSRRLGFLHDSENAQKIVRGWLSAGGILSDFHVLNETGFTMLRSVAPVLPDTTLDVIERNILGEYGAAILETSNRGRDTVISLLRHLAYDVTQFQRSATLLARFVIASSQEDRNSGARGRFLNLFQLYLSGTHAGIDQRLRVVDELIASGNERSISLGLDALDVLLEAWHFSSMYGFDFGAHPRNYGWHPRTREDIVTWYRAVIIYAQRFALSDKQIADNVRSILAKNFRGLWSKAAIFDELEAMALALSAQKYWSEGWIAVRATIKYDAADMSPEYATRLRALEERLRPSDLFQRARSYVFSKSKGAIDIADGDPEEVSEDAVTAYTRAEEVAERLGREISQNRGVLDTLMPDLVRGDAYRGWQFGRGLAFGAVALDDMWKQLVDALIAVPEKERNLQVLRGFLSAAATRDPIATGSFLDNAITHDVLGCWFPVLQSSVEIGPQGAARLETALRVGLAPSWLYESISYGRVMVTIPAPALCRLILGIAAMPAGFGAAVNIYGMSLHSFNSAEMPLSPELIQCGRKLVGMHELRQSGRDHMFDHHIGEIIDTCFVGSEATGAAIAICHKLRDALQSYLTYPYYHKRLLGSLIRVQPLSVLGVFMEEESDEGPRLLENTFDYESENPWDGVPADVLVTWAQSNPSKYLPRLAAMIMPYRKNAEQGSLEWTPLALRILGLATDRVSVLNAFGKSIYPRMWSGSLAEILEGRRVLFQTLMTHPDPAVAAWARSREESLTREIESERRLDRRAEPRFE